ncbi:hypothetical protein D9M68_756620 [compost metagenome]
MMARLGSRPTEKVAPMASRLIPNSNASGRPMTMVPKKCPNSWNTRAQPASRTCGRAPPTIRPSLARNGNSAYCR